MRKLLLLLCFLAFGFVSARAQTIGFFDMSDMVHLSMGQVDDILIKTGKFKLNNKEELSGQILATYQTIDKSKRPIKGETLVTGAYNTTKNGEKLHTITYKSVYPAYIFNLMKQMDNLGYRQTFKGADNGRFFYIYDNVLYHVTVVLKKDGSDNFIEIRQKDLGIE